MLDPPIPPASRVSMPDFPAADTSSPPPADEVVRAPAPAMDSPLPDGEPWMNRLRVGDMVWGKVKSHPWWPGHIYDHHFANPDVHLSRRDRTVLVAFFGDSSYGWFTPGELHHFAPTYTDKITQAATRNFSVAVAEADDEVARRAALGGICPCRYPGAFRPAPRGYLTVDVPGFERGALYSRWQIAEARALFVPQKAMDFLKLASLEPREASERNIHNIQMVALLTAYRRSRYEEFDETYAQAFGMEPVRGAPADEQVATRAAPLAGKQKTPEQLGGRKGGGAAARLVAKLVPSAAPAKASKKGSGSKKNQFLLKRREEARVPALPPSPSVPDSSHRAGALPDVYPATTTVVSNAPGLDQSPPGFSTDPATPPMQSVDEYMLQRRAPPVAAAAAGQGTEGVVPMDATPTKKVKKQKIRKRERAEQAEPAGVAVAGEAAKKKRKKKLNGVAPSAAPASAKPRGQEQSGAASALQLPKLELDAVDLNQVLGDLHDLALDPFRVVERNVSDAVRGFVLAFRSKFYQKSLANAPLSEADVADARSGKPNAELTGGMPLPPLKPAKKKQALKPADATKAGKKRPPSDRQEELAVKKKHKLDKAKALAGDKKAGLNLKDTGAPPANVSASPAAPQQPRPSNKDKSVSLGKKVEKVAEKVPAPTALMIKFPPSSTLPSVASLKARFIRFGTLDVDGIRVYWKSHMCKVIYKFREDAEIALNYARKTEIFGKEAHFYLRTVESSAADPGPESATQRADNRSSEATALIRLGSSATAGITVTQSRPPTLRTPAGQPKSILKKSSDDGVSAAVGTLREAPRVKFMLDGGDSKADLPPSATSAAVNGSNGPDAPATKIAKSVSFTPPPLQPPARPAQPPLHPPARAPTTQPLAPPQPFPPRASDGLISMPSLRVPGVPVHAAAPKPPQPYTGGNGRGVDISSQMLKLLVQCNDIVNVVKSSLGYVPYHPI